ncbi:MAG: hypothetical protein Q9170_004977 [Blastenia crenularia]
MEDRCPIIVGESYELAETEASASGWEHCESSLDQVDSQAALLSMSGYGKLPDHSVNSYVTNAGAQEDSSSLVYGDCQFLRHTGYAGYGQRHLSGSTTQPSPAVYNQHAEQLGYATHTYSTRRPGYETTAISYPPSVSRSAPVITSWGPQKGPQGTPLCIYIKSNDDLTLPTSFKIAVVFAAYQCSAHTTPLDSSSTVYDYALLTEAPPFLSTGWRDTEVPIRLHLQDQSGATVGSLEVGSFRYIDQSQSTTSSTKGMPRKRKVSPDSAELSRAAAKKAVTQQLLSRASQDYVSSPCHAGSTRYPSTPRTYLHSPSAASFSSYEAPPSGFRRRSSTYSAGSVQSWVPHANQRSGWSSNHASIDGLGANTAYSVVTSSTSSPFLSTTLPLNPRIVRTSQLPGAASLSSSELESIRASLSIPGDLDAMQKNWTADERKTNRRLVHFWRQSQNGRFVSAGFEPVTTESKTPKNTSINCIYWERKGECYITSVDAISVLEIMVGERFDVPEKNRVRRNFSGFEPVTMHKHRSEDAKNPTPQIKEQDIEQEEVEEFFRVIMTLPQPRPRNIEKAIKVYPWRLLGRMLTQVMRKYSADYISTGHLPSATGSLNRPINNTLDTYPNSPYSTTNSTISGTCSVTSWPRSSTTSPNMSHNLTTTSTTYRSPSETKMPTPSSSLVALPSEPYGIKYSNTHYPYSVSTAMYPTSLHSDNTVSNRGGLSAYGQHPPTNAKYALASALTEEDQKAHILRV